MKDGRANSGRSWSLVAAALLSAAGAAPAQAPTWGEAAGPAAVQDQAPDLGRLIRSLESDEWAVRQHAEDALRESLIDLGALEAALQSVDFEVSLEARRRLIKLGEEVFLRSPRPGVGIQYSRGGEGVRIDATVRGFDANEHLKAGDVILSFGGMATPDEESMRTAIMVHDPEDVVPVDVRRDNEIVSLQLRLGWYRDLQNPRPPDAGAMRRAWAVRAGRHLNAAEEQIASVELDPAIWQGADVVTRQAQMELQQQRRMATALTPEVSFAGSPTSEERLLVAGRRDPVVDERRRVWLEQLDARVQGLSERISALEAARSRLNGEDADAIEQIDRELARIRELRDELLGIRDTNRVP